MKNKVNAKILRRVAKKLCRRLKVESPCYVEVEDPKIRTDFLHKPKKERR